MRENDTVETIRTSARSFELGIPQAQRKRLGQYFSGLPLGSLLAQLALDDETRSVIDPMAGHGDLLDASATAALARGALLDRLDGIELDPETAAFCRFRMTELQPINTAKNADILIGSAFDPSVAAALNAHGYDLVITNPPYVRYQSQNRVGEGVDAVRTGLSAIVDARTSGSERVLWQTLVKGYSGLADLSVPAWILSALLTRPGGRLALVVPATWRSRDYADVVRYILLRNFRLEFIIADTQPGWFSDAMVRTHLVVARRLTWCETAIPLANRLSWPTANWLQIAPTAAGRDSLVGSAFLGREPEKEFAAWSNLMDRQVSGIESRPFALEEEWRTLEQRLHQKNWFRNAESQNRKLLPASTLNTKPAVLTEGLREMLPPDAAPAPLLTLEQAGIRVSQGLRSGCNRFFYVTRVGKGGGNTVIVEASKSFQNMRFHVPKTALRPVLHRQVGMLAFAGGHLPSTHVLDLSNLVLPEDQPMVARAAKAYMNCGVTIPQVMPTELASFVRLAARFAPDPKDSTRHIPDLSAVRTNIRQPDNGLSIPRFWYMLPAFTARHLPAIFIPRINHGKPAVALNTQPPILVDANFSTLWAEEARWTHHALYALFSSNWCLAAMETAGTPLGGGALKLEATQIRHIPVPKMLGRDCETLEMLGRKLEAAAPSAQNQIDMFILAAALPDFKKDDLNIAARNIGTRIQAACISRQRTAHDL